MSGRCGLCKQEIGWVEGAGIERAGVVGRRGWREKQREGWRERERESGEENSEEPGPGGPVGIIMIAFVWYKFSVGGCGWW